MKRETKESEPDLATTFPLSENTLRTLREDHDEMLERILLALLLVSLPLAICSERPHTAERKE